MRSREVTLRHLKSGERIFWNQMFQNDFGIDQGQPHLAKPHLNSVGNSDKHYREDTLEKDQSMYIAEGILCHVQLLQIDPLRLQCRLYPVRSMVGKGFFRMLQNDFGINKGPPQIAKSVSLGFFKKQGRGFKNLKKNKVTKNTLRR